MDSLDVFESNKVINMRIRLGLCLLIVALTDFSQSLSLDPGKTQSIFFFFFAFIFDRRRECSHSDHVTNERDARAPSKVNWLEMR